MPKRIWNVSISGGKIIYDGPPWAELSKEDRVATLKACVKAKVKAKERTYEVLAYVLNALGNDRRPSRDVLIGFASRNGIMKPKEKRRELPVYARDLIQAHLMVIDASARLVRHVDSKRGYKDAGENFDRATENLKKVSRRVRIAL